MDNKDTINFYFAVNIRKNLFFAHARLYLRNGKWLHVFI